MNDLFSSSSFKKYTDLKRQTYLDNNDMEIGGGGINESVDLAKFFEEVEAVKEDLRTIEALYRRLQDSNQESSTIHDSRAMKALRSRMDSNVEKVLRCAKSVKAKLEALECSNANNRKLPGCGLGTSADRTRTSIVAALEKKLKDIMDDFQEIQERRDAVREIERSLLDLHQVFLDMAALVEAQGHQLNDIESHVAHANSFVRRGNDELHSAKEHQKSSRKWPCIAITLGAAIVIIIPILSSILR
ncbi:Syntaxin-124 [Acorus gramineus]|uniref:Syntaxin-124 n=1 Tax=Acorus gramineus TaxID=55184 RepID=A0AAV8ZZ25_ACOGR|nr:Syntaxin-124 [Acorus gramineus]